MDFKYVKLMILFGLGLTVLLPSKVDAQWRMINFVNEFGEVTDRGAVSASVKSIRPMSFPYQDVEATIFVDCNRAWIRFSEAPNLLDGDINNGYTNYNISVRVSNKSTERWSVSQTWGDKDLGFRNDSKAIAALSSGSSFAIALSWYGQSSVAFKWDLSGSSKMIKSSCD